MSKLINILCRYVRTSSIMLLYIYAVNNKNRFNKILFRTKYWKLFFALIECKYYKVIYDEKKKMLKIEKVIEEKREKKNTVEKKNTILGLLFIIFFTNDQYLIKVQCGNKTCTTLVHL